LAPFCEASSRRALAVVRFEIAGREDEKRAPGLRFPAPEGFRSADVGCYAAVGEGVGGGSADFSAALAAAALAVARAAARAAFSAAESC
jgi:hypothetical protein